MSDIEKTIQGLRIIYEAGDLLALADAYEALQAEIAELREALGKVKDVLDYGRRHSHGMYAFTKMKEGYEKAEALIADVLDKHTR